MNLDQFWELFFIYLPFAQIKVFFPALLFIGFSVGVVSSFLGVGGAWIVTPALNILGFPMAYAIGTDIAHVGPKGILATVLHAARKNVDFSLALCMVLGTVLGIEAGAQTVMALEKTEHLESVLRWVYIALLSIISATIFSEKEKKEHALHKVILRLPIPPFVSFRGSGIRCSIWIPVFIGAISGFVAGFLGIGGGLLRLPMLIYCMGCPPLIAVGTDLFEVAVSGLFGGVSYAMKGRVDFLAALLMFLGAIIGTRFGVVASSKVEGTKIKSVFGFAVTGCLISIVFKQFGYPTLSKFCIFILIASLLVAILRSYFQAKKKAVITDQANG